MIHSYQILQTIGKGSYGFVYKVINKENGWKYAMKKLRIQGITTYEKMNIINELRILATHESPFIIRFKNAFVYSNNLYLITEYAEKGDLSNIIKEKSKSSTKLTENEIWHYFLQISIALNYLHKLNIIHRDIKPANIFVDKHNNIKLGDLGIIKMMKTYMMYGQTQIGTPLYMSPEIYKRERYDSKADVWALGCILYELMTLKPAFYSDNISDLKCKIFAGRLQLQNVYSNEMKDILFKLINIHPRTRPSLSILLSFPFIKEQMILRQLQSETATLNVRNLFFSNCLIPKNEIDWRNVIDLYTKDFNYTVRNANDAIRVQKIYEARIAAEKKHNMHNTELKEKKQKIETILKEIKDAKLLIAQKEEELKQLQKDVQYNPIPPLHSRLPTPSPRTNAIRAISKNKK